MDGAFIEFPGGTRVNLRRATDISYVGADADEITVFFYFDSNERIRIKVTTEVLLLRILKIVLSTDYRQHRPL